MTSLFRLYYSTTSTPWELIPSKLFKIDDIESYLATKSYQQVEDVQYIKHGLEIEVKLNLTQDQAQPLASSGFKYMSIRNGSEETCYYYVKKTTWRSKTCVRFELVMDVLNSLAEGTHYSFKDNTKITREHKDRFKLGLPEISIRLDHPTWTGDLEVGDEITFKYEDLQLGWQNICQGKILFVDIYTEEIHFMCTDGTDPDDIAQVI
ncbi:MAG: hypothetical protein J6S85_17500, partial [Methanobrevibacter sp.]|nr:hypothetical protein [Methanobrevibacter sp.]